MKGKTGKRYTEEQIIRVLDQIEAGTPIEDVCREHGVVEATIYRWRKKYGGMSRSELSRVKKLEADNARLKKLLAERDLEIDAIKEVLSKKW